MEKITGISNSGPVAGPGKPGKPKHSLFQEKLDAVRSKGNAAATAPERVGALGEVVPTILPTITTPAEGVIRNTHRLLDLLDTYARDMENSNKTLKDIEPLIVSIQQNASRLMEEANSAVPEDTELKEIAAECAVTATVEYIKFYRGDYV